MHEIFFAESMETFRMVRPSADYFSPEGASELTAIRNTILANGMRVLVQTNAHYQSATVGLFIKRGSRHELKGEHGLCHFLEHCVFKGTGSYGARQLAETFDHYGCQTDAFTTKEETSFSIKVLGQHLQPCLDLWLAMLAQPTLDPEELERERMVILEEIKMEEDNPEDRLQERCFARYWKDHPLALPILGLPHQIEQVSATQIRDFHKRHYRPDNMVVVAIGAVDLDLLCQKLLNYFPAGPESVDLQLVPPTPTPFMEVISEGHLEQVNFNLMLPGLAETDPRRWAMRLLNNMLGGGMSSRLFQAIREERGLAYAIGSYYGSYSDTGHLTIYGGCSPEHLPEVVRLTLQELRNLAEHGPSEAELIRAINQSISGLTMAQESSYARMQAHAGWLLSFQEPFNLSEATQTLRGVTREEVRQLAQTLFEPKGIGYGAIGPINANFWCDHFAIPAAS